MKPSFDVDLDYVKASYQSPHGTIKSYWKKENDQLRWNISVPGNATAVVYLPARQIADVREGNALASSSEGVRFLKMENGKAVFEIGSGNYSFMVNDYRLTKND
jgi:alpha-L-rhamnosidase